MGKSKSTSQQSNQFQYMAPPTNPHYEQAKALIDGYDGGAAGYREAAMRNRNDIMESGNEMFGASTPDYARDKVRENRLFKGNLQLGRDLYQAKNDEIQYKNAGYMSLGGATAPQLVQTGSSGQQTQTPSTMSQIGQGMGLLTA